VIGSVYMGLGEALMEEQVFRRLPPKMSNALVHRMPSLLEYKSPTALDMPEVGRHADRRPGPELPVRREGSRAGAAAAGDAGARERDLRRGRRADRRDPDHAGQGLARVGAEGARQESASGAGGLSAGSVPEPIVVLPPWEGGDGNSVKEAPKKKKALAGVAGS
jgi:hypothetical protein